ncbi:MAG: cation-translocating P-type ATPase [Aquabacterium sp.]|jgi:Cu2+-exporting ATPase|uniref:heavy metal translocating P-type ATPase n=1 Tax=Aquabacterium sp. TaxID=1872578 RepID=UPI002A36CA5B|nr:cation-translocating P-type ATPase [Aquabacterium sp.]MDX9842717.1 cation-translocating P-type ATPase [Aquabacterium sp.]
MNNVATETGGATAAVLTPAQQAGLDDPDLLQQCIVEIPMGSSQRRIGLGLSGMYCAACAITIEDALRKVPGVSEVQVQSAAQRARILVDPARVKLSELVVAVQQVGYRAWPDGAARAGHERLRERRVLLWRLSVAAFCMMQVMMITWPQYVAGQDVIPPDLWNLMNWACWVLSLPVMLFSCGPFFTGAWRAARQGRVSMDTPVSLGMMGAFVVSTGVTFGSRDVFGHEAYFDSLTMFVTFLLAGRWLESRARERVTQTLESMCVRLPEAVDRADNPDDDLSTASVTSTPLSSLRHGDRVRVAVGQAFPADGLILLGETEVDESLLTGESRALPRRAGQTVVAGSMNMGSPVWMAIERLGPDTRYQQIVSLVHQAMTEKPGWMRFADRMAAPFLWGVILLAAGGALAWQWIDPSKSIWVAVSVLVVTCPCALSLSAPSALLAAAGAMARKGLLVRRLDALEALSAIDEVYFDKTGTLTEGELSVVSIATPEGRVPTSHGLPAAQVERWGVAAALASYSQHPLSRSLVKAAQDAGGWPTTSWVDVREQAGKGVQATDALGRVWRLGQLNWVLADVAPQSGQAPGWWMQHDDARVWMAAVGADGALHPDTVAGFVFDEVFRAEARPTVQRLRELGCHSSLLSGDQSARVHAAAQHLGQGDAMTVAQAQATPEDKLNVIARMQAQGHRVAVVGDGINDAPVLAKADVSIALDQGAALAQSQADLIILGGRLLGLPEAVVISRQAMRIVRQNLAWSAIYNASCIPLALMGLLPPWLAGLGMALSSLGVVLNALRLGPGRH